jgi:hypothetical protein
MSAAFYEIAPDTQVMQFEVSKIEEVTDDEDSDAIQVALLKSELKKAEDKMQEKKKKTVRFDSIDVPSVPSWATKARADKVREPAKPPMVPITIDNPTSNPAATSTSNTAATFTSHTAATPTSHAALTTTPHSSPSNSTPTIPTVMTQQSQPTISPDNRQFPTSSAQYCYQSAIEDLTVARILLERSLDAPIQTTTRELLATSGDLRKQFKDMIISRQVAANAIIIDSYPPVQSVESFLSKNAKRYDPVIAEHFMPLRVIYPEFENGL